MPLMIPCFPCRDYNGGPRIERCYLIYHISRSFIGSHSLIRGITNHGFVKRVEQKQRLSCLQALFQVDTSLCFGKTIAIIPPSRDKVKEITRSRTCKSVELN